MTDHVANIAWTTEWTARCSCGWVARGDDFDALVDATEQHVEAAAPPSGRGEDVSDG